MAIPRTGQLGAAALGSLWLGAPAIWEGVTPPTVRVRSAVSAAGRTSAISAPGAKSSVSAATVKGGIE